MKFLNLIFLKLLDKRYLYIILILQIFIGTYTINMAVGTFRYYNYIFETSDTLAKEKPLLLGIKNTTYRANQDLIKEEETRITDKLKSLYNIREVAVSETLNINCKGQPFKLIMYDTNILDLVKRPLSSGKWLENESFSSNTNPIIITGNLARYYQVGDSFKIDSICDKIGKVHTASFKVCGILKNPDFGWNFDFGSSRPLLQFLLNRQSNSIFTGPIKDINGENISGYIQPYVLAFVKDKNMTGETEAKLRKSLGDKFNISTFDEVIKNGKEYSEDDIFTWSVYSLITLLLIIIGIGGNNILLLHQQFREYGVYFMCGASKLKLTLINAATNMIIIAFPSVLAISIIMFQRNSRRFYNLIFDTNSIIFSIGTSISIFVLSTGFVLVKLYRQQPINIIRGNSE